MQRLLNKLSSYPIVVIVLVTTTVSVSSSYLIWTTVVPWYESLFGSVGGPREFLDEFSVFVQITTAVFLVPLIETAVFQLLVIFLLLRFTRFSLWTVVSISALLFAATHHYSVFYIIYALWGGFIFATVFIACLQKKGYGLAFWTVVLIHALHNSFSFL